MNQILHKNIVAIIGQCSNGTIRGSGILISSNLVLTCAHNMFSSVGDRETTTKIKIKE